MFNHCFITFSHFLATIYVYTIYTLYIYTLYTHIKNQKTHTRTKRKNGEVILIEVVPSSTVALYVEGFKEEALVPWSPSRALRRSTKSTKSTV